MAAGSSPPQTSPRGRRLGATSLTRPSAGVEVGATVLDEATGRPRETSTQRIRLRTSVGHVIAVRCGGGGGARPAAADAAMRYPR